MSKVTTHKPRGATRKGTTNTHHKKLMQAKLSFWNCHKTIQAGKIVNMTVSADRSVTVLRLDVNGVRTIALDVDKQFMEKHKPFPGGYYCLYPDGYESFSPAKAFEDGYRLGVNPSYDRTGIKLAVIGLVLAIIALVGVSMAQAQQVPIIQVNADLSWQCPSTRENLVPITCSDIASYNLVYQVGPAIGIDANVLQIQGGTTTSYTFNGSITTTISDVLDGSVQISYAISAVDNQGLESRQSDPITAAHPVPADVIAALIGSPPGGPVIINATGTITVIFE